MIWTPSSGYTMLTICISLIVGLIATSTILTIINAIGINISEFLAWSVFTITSLISFIFLICIPEDTEI